MSRHRRDRRFPILIALFALLAVAVLAIDLAPAAAAMTRRPLTHATAHATPPTAQAPRPFRIDLADANDFVAQANFVQCVGASMQMMLNIMGDADRTTATQKRLQSLARTLSGPSRTGFQRKGASVRGWSDGLNSLDAVPYRLIGTDSIEEAMRLAASSTRETGQP